MFLTIRSYSPKNGAINKASLSFSAASSTMSFCRCSARSLGFSGYYVVSVADRELVTLSFCESAESSREASRCSAEYTFRNPLVFELGRPEVVEGEVLTFAQVPGEAGGPPASGGGAAAAALALWFEESRAMLLTASEQ